MKAYNQDVAKAREFLAKLEIRDGIETLESVSNDELAELARLLSNIEAHHYLMFINSARNQHIEKQAIQRPELERLYHALEVTRNMRNGLVLRAAQDSLGLFQLFFKPETVWEAYQTLSQIALETLLGEAIKRLKDYAETLKATLKAMRNTSDIDVKRWLKRYTPESIRLEAYTFEEKFVNSVQLAEQMHAERDYSTMDETVEVCLECVQNLLSMFKIVKRTTGDAS